jgi:hypothetical protein
MAQPGQPQYGCGSWSAQRMRWSKGMAMEVSRAPAGGEADVTESRNQQPELTGIGGWLVLVAIGQVFGIFRILFFLRDYYTRMDARIFEKYPAAIWGEAVVNAGILALVISTTVLFFRRSRKFPRFFICEMIAMVVLPIITIVWVAFAISIYSGRTFWELASLDREDGIQLVAAMIGAAVWIPYILLSQRVANTFTK